MQTSTSADTGRSMWVMGLLSVLLMSALFLGGCAGSSKSESTGEYVDDSVITTKVKAKITNDMGVGAAASINVETFKGTVQLSGFADSETARTQAASIAASVKGVQRVENKISLK